MEKLEATLDVIVNEVIWGWPLLIFILIVGLYFSFKTRFVTLRYLRLLPKLLFQKNDDSEKMSAYQSITLILANHVGTGNIVGVASAILYGGPGAILYMWLISILASVLAFAENTLGQMYKVEVNQEYRGGPAYYIKAGLQSPFWAHVMAFCFLIALGLFMPTIQAATISTALSTTFEVSKVVVAIVVTGLIAFVIIGNTKRLITWAEVLVPFMAIFYMIITIIVIGFNFDKLGSVFVLIFDNAFNRKAVFGGIIGAAINYGVRRGLFTNEAGLGSGPNIMSSANVKHPVHQGLISSLSVFIDTIVICSATALMLFITNSYNVLGEGGYLFEGLKGIDYDHYVQMAVGTVFHRFGMFFIAIALFLFGFTALFSGFYNSQTNLIFLFRNEKHYRIANRLYQFIFLGVIFFSSIYNTRLAWKFTDIGVGFGYFLHLFVLLLLSKQVLGALDDFETKLKTNDDSKYVNKNLPCWKSEE